MVNFAEVRAQFCNFMDHTNSWYPLLKALVLCTIFYFRSFRKSDEGFYSCHLPGQQGGGGAGRGNAEDCSILPLSPDRELKDKEY